MEAYIKAYTTFRTTLQRPLLDYSIYLDSLNTEKSTATLEGDDLPGTLARQFLVINGRVWWIDTVTPGKGTTQFSILPPDEIFNRKILYGGETALTIGGFIRDMINAQWVNQADTAYALPYIEVTNLDLVAFVPPEIDENGVFNLLEYIRMVRAKHGVHLIFTLDYNTLEITIEDEAPQTHTLVLNDGHTQLSSSSFAQSRVAKITAIQPVDTGEVDEDNQKIFERVSTDWYLTTDGQATDVEPTNRAEGDWAIIVLSEKDDPAEKVTEEFAKNGESHKVQLWTDEPMAVNDRFRIRLNGQVFEGGVVAISRRKGDNRTLYTSGELVTTIQERVRQNIGTQSGYTGDGSGQMYAVGDIFTTTRPGNPAVLLGYGAWVQIEGAFLFGADSSHPVTTKGGSASHTLTNNELPAFQTTDPDGLYVENHGGASGSGRWTVFANGSSIQKQNIGGGQAFSIMPPYFSVFIWLRKE